MRINDIVNTLFYNKLLFLIIILITPLIISSCDEESSPTDNSQEPQIMFHTQPNYLFVQQAQSGTFENFDEQQGTALLTLYGVSPLTTWFTDRPFRETGTLPTGNMLNIFLTGGIFPNAALEIPNVNGKSEVVVFTIINSDYNELSSTLEYEVAIITGNTSEIIPVYVSANTSLDPDTDQEISDDTFPSQFGPSSLFIDNLSTSSQDDGDVMCTNATPIAPIDSLQVYDYGDGIKTYDPCCAQNPPAECLPNISPICRPADPAFNTDDESGIVFNGCLDTDGNVLGCTPTEPCPVETDSCNKILGAFYCCTWEQ